MAADGGHTYEQLFHFIPVDVSEDPESLAVWSTTPDQPNLALVPVVDSGLSLEIAEGRHEPTPQGWYYADTGPRIVPAPCVIYKRAGRFRPRFRRCCGPCERVRRRGPRSNRGAIPVTAGARLPCPMDGSTCFVHRARRTTTSRMAWCFKAGRLCCDSTPAAIPSRGRVPGERKSAGRGRSRLGSMRGARFSFLNVTDQRYRLISPILYWTSDFSRAVSTSKWRWSHDTTQLKTNSGDRS